MMDKITEYTKNFEGILKKIETDGAQNMRAAARLLADTLEGGHNIFLLGTGHSHMLAEELFYRAGGLVNIRPILETSLMLHESASKSTELERLSDYAEILYEHYGISRGDTVIIISNSGRNGVPVDMALICRERGVNVIALTSMNHTMAGASRHKSGKRLCELADLVLDNYGCTGDASVFIPALGRNAAPTSTAAGAIILNAIEAQTVENLAEDGFKPEVFASSNVDGGDEINREYIKKYKKEIISL